MANEIDWERVGRAGFEADEQRPALYWEDATPTDRARYVGVAQAVSKALGMEPVLQTFGPGAVL